MLKQDEILMVEQAKRVISRIGETDQLYLIQNTPELALERSDLRLQLVTYSNSRSEQIHFLQEAVVLLEQARVEFEEMPMRLYVDLSLHLAKAYMLYFEITREVRFALITQQVLKPLTNSGHGDIFFFLAYASVRKEEFAMARHWLNKYAKTHAFDQELMQNHSAFDSIRDKDWFIQLCQSRMN